MEKFDCETNMQLSKKFNKLFTYSCIIDDNISDKKILLIEIPFSNLISLNDIYCDIFKTKDISKLLLSCSGACSLKHENFEEYMIIINSDMFHKLHKETQNFIISHEIGHIYHGECEPNFTGVPDEHYADQYAISKGYRLRDTSFKIALFETLSLIPFNIETNWKKRLKFSLLRFKLLYNHYIDVVARRKIINKRTEIHNKKKKIQDIVSTEIKQLFK